jgi:hypothetical protein
MFRRSAAVPLALLVGLLALPACKKKDGPPPTDLGLRADANLRRLSQNHLKQIGLGMHSANDATGFVPAGFYGPDGKIGLSWRVAILPYIEEQELYNQFKLDEPWDSPNNKKLIPRMPKIYGPPDKDINTNGHTYLRAFAGNGALLPLNATTTGQAGQLARGAKLWEISDGTSNTLMVVEAAEAVIWTKPDELEFNPDGQMPKLGGVFRDGVTVLLCDGSTRFVKGGIAPATLKALITIRGGEIITEDW